jgi:YD repeat-containing protein
MFVRDYRSDGYSYPASFTANLWGGLGNTWTHNYAGYLSSTPQSIWVSMGAAPPLHFAVGNGSTFPRVLSPIRPDTRSKLVETLLGEFAYYTEQNDLIVFRGGVPVGIYAASGWGVELTYAANRLNLARETSGRTLQFGYSEDEHLTSVVDPAGQVITYRFKNRLLDSKARPIDDPAYTTLTGVVFQDQKTREYQVPDWSSNGTTASFATRIHGVVDELGAQYETVTYDSNGFATSSELAGGVDRYQVGSGVTDPLGTRRTYQFDAAAASPSSLSQPAGSGSAAAITSVGYDANGNVASRTDFNGSATCYGNDLTRNIETVRVEGLTSATACSSYTAAGASLPTGARKVSMQWHPEWRLPTRVAEPGRITTHVYNGQPDPFAAGAVASCAPTAALLPDGKPIAVRCRQVDQATTDGNGSQGFTATVQAGVANREQKWTYNQYGQVLTHDGPRVDVSDVTTYAYYSDTSYTGTGADAVGHTTGDLQSITDAAGQITRFTKYNKHGLLLESIDANGVVTSNTYDLRLRLLSSTVAGQTTSYSYDAAGQLLRITWPDASYIGYEYDPAHRQTAVFDNLGNRIEYMLDNAGNRIAEIVKDPSGALARTLSRSIDALGRVQQGTGRQ